MREGPYIPRQHQSRLVEEEALEEVPPEQNPEMSRRNFLMAEGALAVAGVAASTGVIDYALRKSEADGKAEKERQHIHPEWWKHVAYPVARELVGQSISPLELAYIRPVTPTFQPTKEYTQEPPTWPLPPKDADHPDIPAFPEVFPPINFAHNLARMVQAKKTLILSAHEGSVHKELETMDRLERGYQQQWERNEVRHMDLSQFHTLIERQTLLVQKNLLPSLPKVVEVYLAPTIDKDKKLSDEQKEELKQKLVGYLSHLAGNITPKDMLAYMATEILPDPERAVPLLEFMTKNGGVEYLERIPSLGDKLLSYGPFQLTDYVIGKGEETKGKNAGSVTYLLATIGHEELVPDSLEKFSKMEDHVRAGYLFAFQNVLTLTKHTLESKHYDRLKLIAQSSNAHTAGEGSTVFVEHLAAAHHNPTAARTAMEKWLSANEHTPNADRRTDSLLGYFPNTPEGKEIKKYVDKSRQNYDALGSRFQG